MIIHYFILMLIYLNKKIIASTVKLDECNNNFKKKYDKNCEYIQGILKIIG